MQQKICNESSKIVTRPFFDGAPNNQGCSVAAGPSRAASSGCRASERARAKSHRSAFHPLALQDPRGRASAGETRGESPNAPWSERQLFLHGKAPDSEPGERRKEERDRQSGDHRRLSNEHVDDEILCAVVVAARGVEGIQNKRKREERNWNVRCKGMDVPGELAAGLAVPTQATCGIASPKVVLFLISNVSCQKWHHLDFLCPFLLLLKIDRSIRVSTMRYSKKRFLLCRPKNLPCAHQA